MGPPRMVGRHAGKSSRRCSGWVLGMFALCTASAFRTRGWTAHGETSPSLRSPKADPGFSSLQPTPRAAIAWGGGGGEHRPSSKSSVPEGPPKCKPATPPRLLGASRREGD